MILLNSHFFSSGDHSFLTNSHGANLQGKKIIKKRLADGEINTYTKII